MRIPPVFLVLLCLLAAPLHAAELGRKADIYLRDGSVVPGVVLGYADGKFHVQIAGNEVPIEGEKIDRIHFGAAVGQSVREILDPPKYHEPTTPPAASRPEDRLKRFLDEGFKTADLQQVMRLLWLLTGRLQDTERLQKVEAELKRRLAASPKPEPDKNLRLALVIVYMAEKNPVAAGTALTELKRDYPEDQEIQKLTMFELTRSVGRWRAVDLLHLPRRPPGSRGKPPEGDRGAGKGPGND